MITCWTSSTALRSAWLRSRRRSPAPRRRDVRTPRRSPPGRRGARRRRCAQPARRAAPCDASTPRSSTSGARVELAASLDQCPPSWRANAYSSRSARCSAGNRPWSVTGSGPAPTAARRRRRHVRRAREDEQQVREAVEVAHALGVDLVAAGDRAPLGAPADGAADVQLRRRRRAAGQHERLQVRQLGVDLVARLLEPRRSAPAPAAAARGRRRAGPRCRRRRRTGRSARAAATAAKRVRQDRPARARRRAGR